MGNHTSESAVARCSADSVLQKLSLNFKKILLFRDCIANASLSILQNFSENVLKEYVWMTTSDLTEESSPTFTDNLKHSKVLERVMIEKPYPRVGNIWMRNHLRRSGLGLYDRWST